MVGDWSAEQFSHSFKANIIADKKRIPPVVVRMEFPICIEVTQRTKMPVKLRKGDMRHNPRRNASNNILVVDKPKCCVSEMRIALRAKRNVANSWLAKCIETVHRHASTEGEGRGGEGGERAT